LKDRDKCETREQGKKKNICIISWRLENVNGKVNKDKNTHLK